MTGTIRDVLPKGFGFIRTDGGDVFFHASGCVGVRFDELQPGDAVTFDVEERNAKPAAVNVRRA